MKQDKFYDTYGKNISFRPEVVEQKIPFDPEPTIQKITLGQQIKKYLMVMLFVTFAVALLAIGGIFILAFVGIFLILMTIRFIFGGRSSGGSFLIIKK